MRSRAVGAALAAGLLIPLAASLLWLHSLPPAHGPDEEAHIDYVRVLATERHLPTLSFRQGGAWSEGHQPPLYYAIGAALAPVLGVGWNLRWLSLVMGIGSVAAWFGIARRLLPDAPWEAACMAAAAGLLPMLSFLSASVNNGALVQLLIGIVLLIGADPSRWVGWKGVGAAALVGAAILTKLSALFLIPWLACAWIRMAMEGRLSRTDVLGLTGRLVLVAGVVAGWWFWRTWILYGDPFGWQQQMAASPSLVRGDRVSPGYLYAVTLELWRSLWAAFGPSARQTAAPSVYIVVSLIAGIGAAGLVCSRWNGAIGRAAGALLGGAVVALLGWPLAVPWFGDRLPLVGGVPVKVALMLATAGLIVASVRRVRWRLEADARRETGLLGLAFLLLLVGVYRYNLDFPQPQGRFLLPCAPVLVFFIQLGWIALLGWKRRWFVLAGVLLLAAVGNVVALVHYGV